MKTISIIVLMLLAPMAFAQQALKPIKISIEAPTGELDRLLRAELVKRRDVIISSKRAAYTVTVAVAPLTEDNQCRGAVAAMLVQGKDDEAHLSIYIGDGLQSLARQLAEKLQEFLHSHREKK